MQKKNIETDFIQFIIDKYSPNPGATASKNDDEKSLDEENDKDDENQEVVEKLFLEYKKIKDKYEYYSLQSKRG